MKTYTVTINRGGTGKTTTAAALAEAAAQDGRKVLLVDLDAQGSLSLITKADMQGYTSYDILVGRATAEAAAQNKGNGLYIIPAAPALGAISADLSSITRLKEVLKPVERKFDICIIDTHPETAELVFSALTASNGVIIPMYAETISLQGFYQVTETIEQIRRINKQLKITGIVITRYDKDSSTQRRYLDAITKEAKKRKIPVLGTIRDGHTIEGAQARQKWLLSYRPKSGQAADYRAVWEKIK